MPYPNNPKSNFFAYLLASNRPYLAGFKKWLFQPGMLFNSQETWWGEQKPRGTPHEGLDLYCFEDLTGQIIKLDENVQIPATFAGKIVKIDRDFLGKSIYLSHEIFAADGRQLYTAYGHTEPLAALQVGQVVAAGEIIAAIAAGPGKSPKIPSHLHLTLAWIPVSRPADRLNWPNLGADRDITLLDPRSILSAPA